MQWREGSQPHGTLSPEPEPEPFPLGIFRDTCLVFFVLSPTVPPKNYEVGLGKKGEPTAIWLPRL